MSLSTAGHSDDVEPRTLLVHYLRQQVGTVVGAPRTPIRLGTGAVALALGCEFVANGSGGERRIAASDFFLELPDEGAVAGRDPGRVPGAEARAGSSSEYEKFNRVAQPWSIVAVAALVKREKRLDQRSTDRADQHGAAAEPAAEGTSRLSDLNGKAD